MKLEVVTEPSFISLGPFHMAVGVNDRVWIQELSVGGKVILYFMFKLVSWYFAGMIFEKSYLGSVSAMKLNGLYASVLFDGKLLIHAVSSIYKDIQSL